MDFLRDIWDFFFGSDEPTPRNIQRAAKALTQPHGDAAPRVNAARRLANWGTPEAIQALLKRFTVQTPSGTVDLDEKQEVHDMLVSVGRPAVEPMLRYLETGDEATYPAQALERILPEEELIERVTELLDRLEGVYTRTPKNKVALIDVLAAHDDPRVPKTVAPFLNEPNDDVTFAAITCLARPSLESDVREAFLELLLATDDRPRIQTRLLEALAELGWPVTGFRRRIDGMLPEGFVVTGKGRIAARGH